MKTNSTSFQGALSGSLQMNAGAFIILLLLTVCQLGSVYAQTVPGIDWIRQYGTTLVDISRGICTDGNAIFVAGYTNGSFPGFTNPCPVPPPPAMPTYDGYVAKYGPDGTQLWLNQFGTSGTENAWAVATDASGIYVSGYTNGLLGQESFGDYDGFIRKYDHSGNVLWTAQFGTDKMDRPEDVLRVDETGLYIVGYTQGSFPGYTLSGTRDLFIAKFSLEGTMLWLTQEGTTGADNCSGIYVEGSGIYVCGYENSSGKNHSFISHYTHTGTKVWSAQLVSSKDDLAQEISADESGLFVSGITNGAFPDHSFAGGLYDAWAAKYDRDGNQLWLKQFGTSGADYGYGISASTSGIYVCGTTDGTFTGQTPNIGGEDIFIAKYNQNGVQLWINQIGSAKVGTTTPRDYAYTLALSSSFAYINGYTNGDIGPTRIGGSDAFLMKLRVNLPPVAICGDNQLKIITETVELDGSGSSDSDGDLITYEWSIVSSPPGSTAELSSTTAVNPTYEADMAGTYVVELIVNDGTEDSDPCSVTITVQTPQEATQDLIADVQELVASKVLNQGQGNSLIVKLENAIKKMDQGNYKAAINMLYAFINQVTDFHNTGILTDEQANALIASAERIIDALKHFLLKQGGVMATADLSTAESPRTWNYPNPFNAYTTIHYSLPADEFVTLKVYNSFGKEVIMLVSEFQSMGEHIVQLSSDDLSTGMYFYRLQAGDFSTTKKLVVLK